MPHTVTKTGKRIGSSNWIEIAKAIIYHEWNPPLEIIDRKAKGIKRNKNIIVVSDLSNRN